MIESLRCLPHDAVSTIWYLQLAGTRALMTVSGPCKQPEQTGVCTATRTAMLPLQAAWHAMCTLAAATDSRYMVH